MRIKIPVIAQTAPEITKAAVTNSPKSVIRVLATRMTATINRPIAAVEYLFRIICFIIFTQSRSPDPAFLLTIIVFNCYYKSYFIFIKM